MLSLKNLEPILTLKLFLHLTEAFFGTAHFLVSIPLSAVLAVLAAALEKYCSSSIRAGRVIFSDVDIVSQVCSKLSYGITNASSHRVNSPIVDDKSF